MKIGFRKKGQTTRAEELRRKREKAAPRDLRWRSRPPAAHPAAPLPTWEIRPRGGAARVQRMYNIPLADPGVEVQLPVLTFSFAPRTLAVILAGLACAGVLFLLTSPMFELTVPHVDGIQSLSSDSIVAASGLQGSNLFLISPAAAENEILKKIPAVRRVRVDVDFDGKVTVTVQEREPILLWVQGSSSYWVDSEGVFFPVLGERADLVRLEVPKHGPEIAFDAEPDMDPSVIVHALELTVALPSGTPLIYDTEHGLGMVDPGGWTVYFGDSGRIEEKLDVYRRLMDSLERRGIRPGMVSVENLRQPFYRR
jgi:hypothetical protein